MRRASVVAIAAAAVGVLAPGSAIPAHTDAVVSWIAPTPPEGAVLGVAAKTQLSVSFAASTVAPNVGARIRTAASVPQGAVLTYTDGNPATAKFRWTPSRTQVGEYRVTFTASIDAPVGQVQRTLVIHVGRANKPPPGSTNPPGVYPKRFVLSDRSTETYRWALVRHRTVARSGPTRLAHRLSVISFRTPEFYRNAIQVLDSIQYRNGPSWVRIRLAILPNGSTGWVPRGSLGAFQTIHTRLTIVQSRMRATLYKRGRPIFSAMVGVGQPRWPTPRGDFYIREKLQGYSVPAYGPRAFGLNARSAVLTDWAGGGFIGIHGTNEPQILPGHVSHGCVRMRNASIMRLFRLMPLGTPVHIS
ncbi:MAG TPA: L,D-transpeptidase [Gaiellaceae bacterium]|nr:L,D-transpeptidase [Gaiellaceae bacterium]